MYANKVGMMHENKGLGLRIGKAPFLHLFHTIVCIQLDSILES